MEEWRGIEGFPDYQASSEGQIRNLRTGRVLTPSWVQGSKVVPVRRDNRPQNKYVHRLVAMAFIRPDIEGLVVKFVNGNKDDCSIRNLRVTDFRAPKPRSSGRKILVVETGDIYNSVQQCADAIDGRREGIYSVLTERAWTYKGYHFKYIED